MQKLFLLIFIASFTVLHAQKVSIRASNIKAEKAFLYSIEGENLSLADSAFPSPKSEYVFDFDGRRHHKGQYRLVISAGKWIDFIYDGDNVNIQTNPKANSDSLTVHDSESSKLYYHFVKLNKAYKTKSELLQFLNARYPKEDDFYLQIQNKIKQLQAEYSQFVNKTSQKDPMSFTARYIKSSQLPLFETNLPAEKQLGYLKSHALDKVDFKDSELIYSDLFVNKSIEYLSYYRNPQHPKELLEKEFMAAVDTLLGKAKINQLVYQHITDYLIRGFKQFGFDRIIDYIVSNYVIKDDICLNPGTEESIQRRIEQNKKLPIQAAAPDITLPDTSGFRINLSEIKSEKILVLFYTSWCRHCREIVPLIHEMYKKQDKNFPEIYAVSLDTKRSDWIEFIKNHQLGWINVSGERGWDSKAAADYYIYATPSMFLIDKNMRIIGKPFSIEELKQLL